MNAQGLTLIIEHHDRLTEKFALECPCGKTAMETMTDSAESMEFAFGILRRQHELRFSRCQHQPMGLADIWKHLSDALAQYAEDETRVVRGGAYDSPPLIDSHKTMRGVLSAMDCPDCDPGVRNDTAWGRGTITTLVHGEACPSKRFRQSGPQSFVS